MKACPSEFVFEFTIGKSADTLEPPRNTPPDPSARTAVPQSFTAPPRYDTYCGLPAEDPAIGMTPRNASVGVPDVICAASWVAGKSVESVDPVTYATSLSSIASADA